MGDLLRGFPYIRVKRGCIAWDGVEVGVVAAVASLFFGVPLAPSGNPPTIVNFILPAAVDIDTLPL